MLLFLLVSCALGYWISQRLFLAYLQAVTLEERHHMAERRRSRRSGEPSHHHLGPTFFLGLDLVLVMAMACCLWALLAHHEVDHWVDVVREVVVLFSAFVTFWMIRSRERLQVFYGRLARVVLSARDRNDGQTPRVLDVKGRAGSLGVHEAYIFCSAVCSVLPLLLFVLGIGPDHWRSSPTLWTAMFAGCFLLPQVVIGVLILREVLPVRRLVHQHTSR